MNIKALDFVFIHVCLGSRWLNKIQHLVLQVACDWMWMAYLNEIKKCLAIITFLHEQINIYLTMNSAHKDIQFFIKYFL